MEKLGAMKSERSKQEAAPTYYIVGALLYMLAEGVPTLVRKASSAFAAIIATTKAARSSGSMHTEKERENAMEKSFVSEKMSYSLYSSGGKYCRKGDGKFSAPKVLWYYDVRIWIPVFAIMILSVVGFYQAKLNAVMQDAAHAKVEAVTEALKSVEAQSEETVAPTEAVDDSEVVELARLADSVGRGRSDDVKRIIMWVAINRSEDRSHGYGLTLLGEIARPKQWQEYTPDATYLESTLKLAQEVYETWQTGGPRPIYSDMLWFILNDDGSITVRNQFQQSKNRAEATFGQ